MKEHVLYRPELDELGFRQMGFRERMRNDEYIFMEREL